MPLLALDLSTVFWALLAVAVVALLFHCMNVVTRRRNKRTAAEVAVFIENFLERRGSEWDWDEFLTLPIHDPHLDRIRERCRDLPRVFPSLDKKDYCSEAGLLEMRRMVIGLKAAGNSSTCSESA